MRKAIIFFLIILLILTGCGKKEAEDQLPKMLEVQLDISPKEAKINEMVTFQAKVTLGYEVVTDADDVSFEIWRENQEDSEKIPVKQSKNGMYELKKSFSEGGKYSVYAHVTARSMHTMPKGEFVIKP